ncbi:MAG: 50S ribosomal protein L23 [Candidatus Saccharimonadales bacterium]
MSKTLTLKPRMSEKTYASAQTTNTFVFVVPKSTNKIEVGEAVATQFGVTVTNVRTIVVKGKKARSIRLGKYRKNVMGQRADYKKAFVTLKEGDSIPIFAAVEEAEAAEVKAAEKAEKKAVKVAKKETK